MTIKSIFCVFALWVISTPSWGQKVRLKRANSLQGGILNGKRFDRVIGRVLFTQQKVAIYCDSAHFFKSQNKIKAFGKIRIKEGDSINIVASKLTYDGNTKVAQLREDIVFKKKGKASLYTDSLDYYRSERKVYYFGNGKLIEGTDTLISEKGYYNMSTNVASFKKDVVGKGEGYTLLSDTLQYDSQNKIIFFRDSATITNMKGDVMTCKSGTYEIRKKVFSLHQGTTHSESYTLSGDSYFLDEVAQAYNVKNNVKLTLIKDGITIHGKNGDYNKSIGVAKVYGNSYLMKVDNAGDTLFMSADTLVSIEKKTPDMSLPEDTTASPTKQDTTVNILLAYNNVKIFKNDLQGVADSMAFSTQDSIVYFFNNPVLWSGKSQMTAESIHMNMHNNTIYRIELIKNPFVVSRDSLSNFNQMKGKKMTAYFEQGVINYVDVDGNGESLYFALDKKQKNGATVTVFMGMNRIICSNMRILFKGEEVSDINFYVNPEASFIPPFALTPKDIRLKGFIWRGNDKPSKADVVKVAKR